MSARELKTELHEQIEALTDEQAMEVHEYVKTQYGEEDNDFDAISPEMMAKLEKSLKQAQAEGFVGIPNEVVMKEMRDQIDAFRNKK